MAKDNTNPTNKNQKPLEDWQNALKGLGQEAKEKQLKAEEERRRLLKEQAKNNANKSSKAKVAPKIVLTKDDYYESFSHIEGEITSFADVMTDVTPLEDKGYRDTSVDNTFQEIKVRSKSRQQDEQITENYFFIGTDIHEDEEPPKRYCQLPAFLSRVKQLARQTPQVSIPLDLHGYKLDEAQVVLNEYIDHLKQKKESVGEVIHGTGLNSAQSVGKMKGMVRHWLIKNPEILGYTEPKQNDGAVYIFIKLPRDKKHDNKKGFHHKRKDNKQTDTEVRQVRRRANGARTIANEQVSSTSSEQNQKD